VILKAKFDGLEFLKSAMPLKFALFFMFCEIKFNGPKSH